MECDVCVLLVQCMFLPCFCASVCSGSRSTVMDACECGREDFEMICDTVVYANCCERAHEVIV